MNRTTTDPMAGFIKSPLGHQQPPVPDSTKPGGDGDFLTTIQPFPVRSVAIFSIAIGTLLIFIASYLLTQYMFVLIEARSYLANAGWVSRITAAGYWLFPTGFNTRYTSMFFAGFVNHTCGVSLGCTNAWESILVALAFATIAFHTFQLAGSIRSTILTAGLWALSAPTLSGVLWQSIQHDKIATILIMLTLSLTAHFFSRAYRSTWSMVFFSILLVALFGIAFNAKEIAFLLPICVGFLAIVLAVGTGGSLLRNLAVVVLPLAYSAWYIAYYFIHLNAEWSHHIAGGSPETTLKELALVSLNLGNFLGLGNWGDYNLAVEKLVKSLYLLFVVTFILLVLYHGFKWRPRAVPSVPEFLLKLLDSWREFYLLLITIICFAAFARTSKPAAFYMMIPFWSSLLLLVLVSERLVSGLRYPRLAFVLLLTLMATPLLISYSTNFATGGAVPRLVQNSASLEESFAVVRGMLPPAEVKVIKIRIPENADCIWYLLYGRHGENLDEDLGPYLLNNVSLRPTMIDGNNSANKDRVPVPGEADVDLSNSYKLERITFNGQVIYQSAGSSKN
jgi:hypothetical protein